MCVILRFIGYGGIIMKALITGASSGIGCEFAKILSEKGFETIIVARREDRLKEVKNLCGDKCRMLVSDLSKKEEVASLYEKVRDENIDILINNAGFGLYGEFSETSLMRELEMIELNICAVHILTKLFLKDFKKRNSGYILNVA